MKYFALTWALGLMLAGVAGADPAAPSAAAGGQTVTSGSTDNCGFCGRHGCCEKYCTVVCEMKEIKKTVWDVKCEDFCAPCPTLLDCCDKCPKCGLCSGCSCDPCAAENRKHYVTPHCGPVCTKKILVKKEVVCKVPSYKCVVQYLCDGCSNSAGQGGGVVAPPANAAPAPAPKMAPPPAPPKPVNPQAGNELAPLPPLTFNMAR
jgi:hypothetical protein